MKSNYIDVFFETKEEKKAFDNWFNSIDWKETSTEELIKIVDDFLEDDFSVIEDYTFGKNGDEEGYIKSVKEYLDELK